MSLFVRMAGDLPTMEKAFFRNAIAAAFAIFILSRTPEKFHIRKESWPDLIRRSLYGTMGVILNFWAIDHITIADASVLNKMSPFFAIIMSAIILKEKATRKEWAIVAIAFFGAVLVIKPTAGIASCVLRSGARDQAYGRDRKHPGFRGTAFGIRSRGGIHIRAQAGHKR